MTPNKLHAQLQPLYDNYNHVVKPLIADIEMLEKKQPILLFNEIRAFNNHIAQCYLPEIPDEEIVKDVNKAEGHIYRLIFDCYKYLFIIYHEKYEKFLKRFENVDTRVINNGDFLIKTRKYKHDADQLLKEASLLQTKKKNDAIKKYQESIDLYRELDILLSTSSPDLWWAKAGYRFKTFKRGVFFVILTILFGVVANIVSKEIGYELFDNIIPWISNLVQKI